MPILNLGYLVILVAATVTGAASRARLAGQNNVRHSGTRQNGFNTVWTKIVEHPSDSIEVALGSRVELHCEAGGYPPPQIYWLSGDDPNRQIAELTARSQEESNTVFNDWGGIGMNSATYVIDCAGIEDQGLKYCVSIGENAVAISPPTAVLIDTTRTTECNSENQPTISYHTEWRFVHQHDTVIIHCRVVGQPQPYVLWLDNLDIVITPATHARHMILPNGDLEIKNIEWGDMGEYVCKVQSGHTQKRESTFLYVVRRDDEKKRTSTDTNIDTGTNI